jgi:hypothetical protein
VAVERSSLAGCAADAGTVKIGTRAAQHAAASRDVFVSRVSPVSAVTLVASPDQTSSHPVALTGR